MKLRIFQKTTCILCKNKLQLKDTKIYKKGDFNV